MSYIKTTTVLWTIAAVSIMLFASTAARAQQFFDISVAASPANYVGKCPVTIKFTTTLTSTKAKAPILVLLWHNRSNGWSRRVSPSPMLQPGKPTEFVSTWIIDPRGGMRYRIPDPGKKIIIRGWQISRLKFSSRFLLTSNRAHFKVTCLPVILKIRRLRPTFPSGPKRRGSP